MRHIPRLCEATEGIMLLYLFECLGLDSRVSCRLTPQYSLNRIRSWFFLRTFLHNVYRRNLWNHRRMNPCIDEQWYPSRRDIFHCSTSASFAGRKNASSIIRGIGFRVFFIGTPFYFIRRGAQEATKSNMWSTNKLKTSLWWYLMIPDDDTVPSDDTNIWHLQSEWLTSSHIITSH